MMWISWNGWKFEERARRMCNFPASPSTPSADKCCVIPSGNFRAKKPNWKSIHFESGPPINTSRASIWLNSHFSTFSTSGAGHLGQNCSHEPKGELRAQGSFTTRNLAHSFCLPGRLSEPISYTIMHCFYLWGRKVGLSSPFTPSTHLSLGWVSVASPPPISGTQTRPIMHNQGSNHVHQSFPSFSMPSSFLPFQPHQPCFLFWIRVWIAQRVRPHICFVSIYFQAICFLLGLCEWERCYLGGVANV